MACSALARIVRPELDRDARAHDAVGDAAHPFGVRRRAGARARRERSMSSGDAVGVMLTHGSRCRRHARSFVGAPAPLHDTTSALPIMPPRCAKCATPDSVPVTPKNSSDARVEGREQPCRHGDRRNQRHDLAVRETSAHRRAAGRTRRPRRRWWAPAARRAAAARELSERRRDHRGEVAREQPARPHVALDLGAEHAQPEHVEQQVREVAAVSCRNA